MRWVVFLIGLEIVAISINFFMAQLTLQLVGRQVFLFWSKPYGALIDQLQYLLLTY